MVLVTKYRKPVLTGDIKTAVYDTIKDTLKTHGYKLIDINGEPDYVHVLFDAAPDLKPTEFVNAVKTRTSRTIRKQFSKELEKYYWKPVFWSDSYFIATVGNNTKDIVQEYISKQGQKRYSSTAKP